MFIFFCKKKLDLDLFSIFILKTIYNNFGQKNIPSESNILGL